MRPFQTFISLLIAVSTLAFVPQQKMLTITVTANGEPSIDNIKIETDDLPKELHQRLWRSFMGNGKMPEQIKIVFDPGVLPENRQTIIKAVQQGQQRTQNVLALHKHKHKFENISNRKQEKIKRQFPVLFQQTFE